MEPIVVDGKSFALNGKGVSYRFHVDEESGDLHADHFGAPVAEDPPNSFPARRQGWSIKSTFRREFPDVGTGDFRSPAVSIKHEEGHTVTNFRYKSHKVVDGKPDSAPLPGTFGSQDKVKTLVIHLVDKLSSVEVDLSYSIFPQYDAIVRNVKVTNNGKKAVTVNKLTSLTVDLPYGEYEYLGLRGEWSREASKIRRGVEYGTQGFGSSSGYSSHHHNPFLSLVSPRTTESAGDAWGFSLIYTGSFSAEVDKNSRGMVRASIGMHPDQLSWPLGPGESLTTPECVAVFSDSGIGSMSRKLHGLYRKHLIRSKFVDEPRPALLNSWEGLYFNFDEDSLERLAKSAAHLGAKLFVLDDGWFGDKKPRLNDHAGLGDWMPNPRRFPNGLKSIADKVNKLQPAGSQNKLKFGIWVEPEMVNPESELYQAHPDWVLHAGNYPRSECRQQLVLNLALKEVQDYIIHFMSDLLNNASIGYIKWDNNRGMHEVPSPSTFHAYMLGLYRVLDTLTTRFPDVLWEGCASGGGRFDPGILQYFPQSWTSDNMDAIDRINIQFGTSLVYPASSMGAHIGACPSHVTGRYQSIEFRAHVAMMGGSFGVELDPDAISEEERNQLPELIKLSEKLNPTIITGDLYRLRLPEESQHPAAMYVSEDGGKAVLFVFQMLHTPVHEIPVIRLQGLDPSARYKLDGEQTYSGATLMNGGIRYELKGDYKSKIVFIDRV